MCRRLGIALVVVLLLPAWATARTWTDNQGKQIEAELVRVHQGNAILKEGNRLLKVPVANFCQTDQDYLRTESQESEPQRGDLAEVEPADTGSAEPGIPPSGEESAEGPGQSRPLPPAMEEVGAEESGSSDEDGGWVGRARPGRDGIRTWTDIHGNTLQAEFVRLAGRNVFLRQNGRVRSYPLFGFCEADQEYVRSMTGGTGGAPLGMDEEGIGGEEPGNMGMGGIADRMRRKRQEMKERMERMRERGPGGAVSGSMEEIGEMEDPSLETAEMASSGLDTYADEPADLTTEHSMIADHVGGDPRMGGDPRPFEEHYECGKCKAIVQGSFKAGDRCPRCNVRWDFVKGADGKIESAGFPFSGEFPAFFFVLLAIGVVVLRIFFVLVVIGTVLYVIRRVCSGVVRGQQKVLANMFGEVR